MPPRSALLQAISIVIINIPYTFQTRDWGFHGNCLYPGWYKSSHWQELVVCQRSGVPEDQMDQKEKSCAQYHLPPSHCLPTFCYRVDHVLGATQDPCLPVSHCELLYSLVVFLRRELQPQALSLLMPTLSECSWVIVFHKGQDGDLASRAKHRLEKLHIAFL